MAKIVFSDVDGTLVHSSGAGSGLVEVLQESRFISEETIGAIADLKADGVGFVLATGRRVSSYLRVRDVIPHDYALIEHGCVIMHEGRVDSEWDELIRPVVGRLGSKEGIIWDYEKQLLREGFRTDSKGRLATFRVYIDKPDNLTEDEKVSIEKKVKKEAGNLGITITHNHGMLDVLPAVGGKANAIKYLIEKKGFIAADMIAMGDDANDLSMLALAEFTACPGNAASKVKQFVNEKGGYASEFSGHEGTVDILRNYVSRLVASAQG